MFSMLTSIFLSTLRDKMRGAVTRLLGINTRSSFPYRQLTIANIPTGQSNGA